LDIDPGVCSNITLAHWYQPERAVFVKALALSDWAGWVVST
jgi:hypothetical protein